MQRTSALATLGTRKEHLGRFRSRMVSHMLRHPELASEMYPRHLSWTQGTQAPHIIEAFSSLTWGSLSLRCLKTASGIV